MKSVSFILWEKHNGLFGQPNTFFFRLPMIFRVDLPQTTYPSPAEEVKWVASKLWQLGTSCGERPRAGVPWGRKFSAQLGGYRGS